MKVVQDVRGSPCSGSASDSDFAAYVHCRCRRYMSSTSNVSQLLFLCSCVLTAVYLGYSYAVYLSGVSSFLVIGTEPLLKPTF